MPAMSQVELPHAWNSTGDGVKRTDLEKAQGPAAPTFSLPSVAQVESLGTQLTDEWAIHTTTAGANRIGDFVRGQWALHHGCL